MSIYDKIETNTPSVGGRQYWTTNIFRLVITYERYLDKENKLFMVVVVYAKETKRKQFQMFFLQLEDENLFFHKIEEVASKNWKTLTLN